MKKSSKIIILSTLTTCALLFSIVFYFSPYLALYQIKEAVVNNDKEQFNNHIDYVMLQYNLKKNVNNNLDTILPTPENGKIIDKAVISALNRFIKKTASELIESKVTAEKLLDLIQEQISTNDSFKDIKMMHKSTNIDTVNKKYLLDYPDLNHFTFILNTEKTINKKIKIYFERKGLLQWRITDIKLE